jgi:hypothetical protein
MTEFMQKTIQPYWLTGLPETWSNKCLKWNQSILPLARNPNLYKELLRLLPTTQTDSCHYKIR